MFLKVSWALLSRIIKITTQVCTILCRNKIGVVKIKFIQTVKILINLDTVALRQYRIYGSVTLIVFTQSIDAMQGSKRIAAPSICGRTI